MTETVHQFRRNWLSILGFALVILKLFGAIDIDWIFVLMPFWVQLIPLAIGLTIIFSFAAVLFFLFVAACIIEFIERF